MKFILSIASAIFILISCSTSPNNNGGSTTTVVPVAPSSLTGTVLSSSSVSLGWVDNSTNETGFKIERRINGTTQFAVVGSVNADVTGFTDVNLTPNTSYEYRVFSFNAVGNSLTYSNTVILTTLSQTVNSLPVVTTTIVSAITNTSAACGGTVTSDGGANVTARGVVWGFSPSPTIALSTKTIDGTGTGLFTSSITGLSANTTYYVRTYATNNVGTAYGSEVTFTTTNISQPYSYTPGPNVTDANGNVYASITTSCGQTWTTKNLTVSRYRNGDIIPQVTGPGQWMNLTTGAWCYYNNDPATEPIYGRLYNWYAVNDTRGLTPAGWHVPTDAEWNKLTICIDANADTSQCCNNVAGTAMKSTSGWTNNGNGTNSSGFSGLPGGYRANNGTFTSLENDGCWWSTSEYDAASALLRSLSYINSFVWSGFGFTFKTYGYSVRIVRD